MSFFLTHQLDVDDPTVSATGLGKMDLRLSLKRMMNIYLLHNLGFGAFYDTTYHSLPSYAANRDMTFWDSADIYGNCTITWFDYPQVHQLADTYVQIHSADRIIDNGSNDSADGRTSSSQQNLEHLAQKEKYVLSSPVPDHPM